MHVMTAYGFDDTGVYLTDPGTAVWRHYDWDSFMGMWNVMDGMALSMYPHSTALQPVSIAAQRAFVFRAEFHAGPRPTYS